jgi:CRISPR-associated protein Cas1
MEQEQPAQEEPSEPIPARMLNEVVYCPRLFYLEHVAREWDDNADTVQGKRVHRRVDRKEDPLPEEGALPPEPLHARSVTVASEAAGIVARTDLIEAEGGKVVPVDYKRGHAPDPERVPGGIWPADRVQLGAQMLALRDSGYCCEGGVIYYAGSRKRVGLAFDDGLVGEVRQAVAEARRISRLPVAPPPLQGSPKCPRCSLVGICLPDETNSLLGRDAPEAPVRQLLPSADDRRPLHVQAQGARIGRSGDCLEIVKTDGDKTTARLREVSHVCVFGSVQVSAAALQELCARDIGVSFFSSGGWYYGGAGSFSGKNVLLRIAQFACAAQPERRLVLARAFVAGKIANCRTLLRRNSEDLPREVLIRLKELELAAGEAQSEESLLGLEGTAARLYFEHFARLLAPRSGAQVSFGFEGRNRRPPRDPVNALLSFAYALLLKDMRVALQQAGFDPMVGFFHKPRHGKPGLALDLMEEFRPLVADSVVLTAVNTEVVKDEDFVRAAGGVALGESGRRAFLGAYERRMSQIVTHPLFRYEVSYRQVFEVQARLLGRAVLGELATYPGFRTR